MRMEVSMKASLVKGKKTGKEFITTQKQSANIINSIELDKEFIGPS